LPEASCLRDHKSLHDGKEAAAWQQQDPWIAAPHHSLPGLIRFIISCKSLQIGYMDRFTAGKFMKIVDAHGVQRLHAWTSRPHNETIGLLPHAYLRDDKLVKGDLRESPGQPETGVPKGTNQELHGFLPPELTTCGNCGVEVAKYISHCSSCAKPDSALSPAALERIVIVTNNPSYRHGEFYRTYREKRRRPTEVEHVPSFTSART